jgi:hypothetical protein
MIYYAQRTYPIIGRSEAAYVSEMRDLMACNDIIAQDDVLSEKDVPLFLKILQIFDFLYFTLMPALMTWMGVYILKSMLS